LDDGASSGYMDNLQPSRVFGAYSIKQKIGSGGMASVFQAVHSETQQEVALKILHEHYADDQHIRKRLEHEARIVMRLNHPHIVSVTGFGEAENRPYLVMPYMEGGSLAQFFSKPRLVKHETTLKFLTILADGLDYAHSQQVVHRDLKLENILLSKNQLLAISDFGIAQSAHTTRITMTGQILGTPQYLAPENLDTNGALNYRADLYAFAVMAYLMLTGYFPFTSRDPLTLAIKHRTEVPPPPSLVNQNLPTTLDAVLNRGLAKDPDLRFASGQEFVEALETALLEAATITTKILVNDLNPLPTQSFVPEPALFAPDSIITRVLPPDEAAIPAVLPEPVPARAKSSRKAVLAFLLLLLCAAASLALFVFNGSFLDGLSVLSDQMQAESTVEATEALVLEATEEATDGIQARSIQAFLLSLTAEATSTASATGTSRASTTPRSSSTSRTSNSPGATNTTRPLPSNTPRPLPTNTPQPQPTSIPPSSVPATSVPPTSVPPTNAPAPTSVPATNAPAPTTILDPIINPVNTLVPCIPIPLVRDCP
jgi:serine/threonine protein kinase